MDFQDYLKTAAEELDKGVSEFFESWVQRVKKISPKLLPPVNLFINSCGGGKKLRGTLIKLGFELTGKKYTPEILKPAIGYEIFNTAILAHDDIIDLSPLRRGNPSIYMALGGKHYGISQAIVLGDIGLFLAIKLTGESKFSERNKNKAIQFLTDDIIETAFGEVLDVELSSKKSIRTEKDVITIAHLKTAQYTISGPLQIGAILAGAKEELLDDLAQFGENLGIAFQIQDDILGVFGDEKTLGKSVTSDIEECKNTLLITQAFRQATREQFKILDRYYGHGQMGKRGLEAVKKVFIETGSLDYSRQQALKYVVRAKKIIPKLTKIPKYRRLLSEFADFLVERDR